MLSFILNSANIFYKKTVLAPIEGGVFREGLVGQPIAINPLVSLSNDVDRDLIELIFSDLADLLESHKMSADGKIWTIELKKNLAWSDGEPLTGDDVIFTLETIQNPDTRSPLLQTWQSVIAEKLNEQEIRFTLKTPYAFFFENLKGFKIVPQHIFGAIPSANLRLSDYNLEPVGSGPFAFAGYEKRRDGFIKEFRLTANRFFYGGKALIKDLRFNFYSNYEDAIAAFNKKEIDALGGLPPAGLSDLKIGHQIWEINIPRYYAIFMNPSIQPVFKNKEVRKALAQATDTERIISAALKEHALPVSGPIYPHLEGWNEDASKAPAFSLDAAKETLKNGQWRPDEDGILYKKVGQDKLRLDLEIIVPDISFLVESVRIIAEDWKSIGVHLKISALNPTEIANELIKTRNYQLIVFGNILKNSPDVFSFWHSSERFYPGLNLALYENRVADDLLESVRRNLDPNIRVRDLKKLQTVLTEDQPAIFLFSPNYLYAGPKTLGGFNPKFIATPADRFEEANKWFLKTARVFKNS